MNRTFFLPFVSPLQLQLDMKGASFGGISGVSSAASSAVLEQLGELRTNNGSVRREKLLWPTVIKDSVTSPKLLLKTGYR